MTGAKESGLACWTELRRLIFNADRNDSLIIYLLRKALTSYNDVEDISSWMGYKRLYEGLV